MKKVSMQIVNIEEKPNPNGVVILKITAKSEGNIYTFAAKEEDYSDEKIRKNLNQGFIRTIKKSQEQSKVPKSTRDQNKKGIRDLIGKEVEEVVY